MQLGEHVERLHLPGDLLVDDPFALVYRAEVEHEQALLPELGHHLAHRPDHTQQEDERQAEQEPVFGQVEHEDEAADRGGGGEHGEENLEDAHIQGPLVAPGPGQDPHEQQVEQPAENEHPAEGEHGGQQVKAAFAEEGLDVFGRAVGRAAVLILELDQFQLGQLELALEALVHVLPGRQQFPQVGLDFRVVARRDQRIQLGYGPVGGGRLFAEVEDLLLELGLLPGAGSKLLEFLDGRLEQGGQFVLPAESRLLLGDEHRGLDPGGDPLEIGNTVRELLVKLLQFLFQGHLLRLGGTGLEPFFGDRDLLADVFL